MWKYFTYSLTLNLELRVHSYKLREKLTAIRTCPFGHKYISDNVKWEWLWWVITEFTLETHCLQYECLKNSIESSIIENYFRTFWKELVFFLLSIDCDLEAYSLNISLRTLSLVRILKQFYIFWNRAYSLLSTDRWR